MLKRALFLPLGFISLILGIMGLLLPLLPTTPFFILAAACFSRSSRKLYKWLMTHSVLGPILVDWESHGKIAFNVKMISTALILFLVPFSLMAMQFRDSFKVFILISIVCVLAFIWTRPSSDR